MLTGEPPSAAVRLQRIVDEQNHFAELLPSLPSNVTELLHRCLQLDPAARPAATDFSRHLHAAAASFDPSAEPPAPRAWRRLGLAGAIGGGLVVGAALVAVWMRPERGIPLPQPPALSPKVQVILERTPASTEVYLDGKRIAAASLELERGPHRLIAVAPGHYGQLQTIQLTEATTLNIELQPTKLPADAEFERFLDLADAGQITPADRDSMTEATLRTALSTKLLRENANQAGLQAMEQDLEALAEVGDARAAVILLLGPAIEAGRIAPAVIDSRLVAAAEGGDAMASFFTALSLRSRVQEAGGTAATKEMRAYCERMAQAAAQGWQAVAGSYLQRDRCKG
jgi:hypothetical protein